MKRNKKSRLHIKRTTIRQLSATELDIPAGGWTTLNPNVPSSVARVTRACAINPIKLP